mmetsp:Transcript_3789/g.9061  ORF Transcript_3789/g.9061 Transcript_3789/m.9061 type:complete len:321 (-) Transcript_3789:146-1108(-)
MNEAGKIVKQWAVRSKSSHKLRSALAEHYAALGIPPPKCIYVDNAEEVEKLLLECYPSIRKEMGGRGEAVPDPRAKEVDANSLSLKHPLLGAFMADISHAMYKPDQEDQNKVRAYLTKTGTDPTTFPKSYFHRHPCIRRYLKQPGELVAALDIVWHQWQSATSRHILKQGDIFTEGDGGTAVEHAKFRALAKGGWLSDPAATAEVFPIHIAVGDPLPKSGLQRYRSLRGTSHLEGYHSHLHKATRDAPNHGPTLAAALLGDLNHRFSIDSASKNVRGEMYYDCYTPWILDQINVIYEVYKQPIPYPGVFVNKIGPTSPSS